MSSIEHRRNPAQGTESWRVRFRHDGANRAVTFTSARAAEAWKAILDGLDDPERALALLDQEKNDDTRVTVANQIDHHITHLTDVEDGTRRRYQKIADRELRPAFGGVLLADLSRDHVSAWVNSLAARPNPPSPKTIRNWQGILSSALKSAVRDGKIPANPAEGIRPAKRTAPSEMVFLTREEFAYLLEQIPDFHRPLILLLTLTGIRWGEATALTVGNLDRATHSARVSEAWKHTESGTMRKGGPKSRRSLRTVAVPDQVFDALAPKIAGKKSTDLVITSTRGNPLRSGTFHNTVWQRAALALQEHCGKKPRVHDLRHSFASWAIQANVPTPVIQRQMGHESITTTVDTYGHLARSDFDPLLYLGNGIPGPAAIES